MTARPTRLTTTFYAGAALSLALGAALLATSLPARAADDDVSLDKKVFRGILEGLGLRKDGEAINYQERAPLVIPPSRALPPPEKSDAVVANNPAWPKDPDVTRRKREAEMERNRNISEEAERERNPLRPDQLTPGGDPRTVARRSQGDAYTATPGDRLSAKEMNQKSTIWSSMFGSKDDEVAKFTQEPPRASLTAPPPGYQTPSPDQPYGVSKAAPKATDYKETHGTLDSGR
ncbi:MAG: hypothetical protein HYX37_03150 [Rhizobiales bacterium]|nr:hypothetical protein [Hyphomicrobiales bacterium]